MQPIRRASAVECLVSPPIFLKSLTHPHFVLPNVAADEFSYRNHMKLGRWHSMKQQIKRIIAFGLDMLKAPPRPLYHAARTKRGNQVLVQAQNTEARRRGESFPARGRICISA